MSMLCATRFTSVSTAAVSSSTFTNKELSLHVSNVLDLPPSFCERVVDAGLSKRPERFSIQNCQLTGREEDTGMMSYDLVQKYRDRAHHGFQSLAGLSPANERMGSIEMAALNVVHAAVNTGNFGTAMALALKHPVLSRRFGRKRKVWAMRPIKTN
jgi:hypothetical protein